MIEIIVPMPPAILSPNRKVCWQAKNTPKNMCFTIAFNAAAKHKGKIKATDKVKLTVHFQYKNKKAYDIDNSLAMLKSTIDGIFKAIEVNDNRIIQVDLHKQLDCGITNTVKIIVEPINEHMPTL